MTRRTARNTTIVITDSGNASRLVSGRSNTATLTFSSEAVDVTSFGAEYRERIADGIKDWELSCAGFWDGAASQIDEILYGVLSACTAVQYGPSGSTSGDVKYSGCAILQDYEISGEVEGAVEWSGTFVAASVLNRGTW